MDIYITKGTKVQASWLRPKLSGLAGMQMKLGATRFAVEGIVRHLRGDKPVDPKDVRVYIDLTVDVDGVELVRPVGCQCEKGHVEVQMKHIFWAENPK